MIGKATAEIDLKKGQFLLLKLENEDGTKRIVQTDIYLKVTPEGKIETKRTKRTTFAKDVTFIPFDLVVSHPELLDFANARRVLDEITEFVKNQQITPKYIVTFDSVGKRNFYVIDEKDMKVNVKLIEKISKTDAKKDLKAYETPIQGMEIVFKPLLALTFLKSAEKAKEAVYMRMKRTIADILQTLPEKATFSFEEAIRMVNQFTPEQIKEAALKKMGVAYFKDKQKIEFFKPESPEVAAKFANFFPLLLKYYNLLRLISQNPVESKQPVGDLIRQLKDEAEKVNIKVFDIDSGAFSLIDWQAGSGRHLKVFEKEKVPVVLFGTELRRLKPQNKNNRVAYGVDFFLFKDYFELSGIPISRSIFYLNPPYTTSGYLEEESVKTVPEGGILLGVFSTKMKNFLLNNVQGIVLEVPKEAVGYDDPNSPENFLVVFGLKNRHGGAIFQKFSETDPSFYQKKIFQMLNSKQLYLASTKANIMQTLAKDIDYFFSKEGEKRLSFVESSIKRTVQELEEAQKNGAIIKKLLETQSNVENLFIRFSPLEKAVSGAAIFPDMRFFGEKPMLNIYQVVENLPLLAFYKNNYPSLYQFVLQVAEKARINLPRLKSKDEIEYVTTENLGVLKLRYYPKTLPSSEEVINVIQDVIEEEYQKKIEKIQEKRGEVEKSTLERIEAEKQQQIKKLKALAKLSNKLILKSITESYSVGDSINFGYTSVLTFVDRFGQDLGALSIPLARFYEKLEEKKIINPSKKYRIAEPDAEMKRKLTFSYIQYINWIRQRYDIDIDKKTFSDYIKALKEKRIGVFLSKFVRETNLIEKFKSDVADVASAELIIRQKLNTILSAYQLDLPSGEIAKAVAELYEKAPKKFYEGRDSFSEKLVRNIVSSFVQQQDEVIDDITASIFEGIAEHYAILDSIRTGALKLTLEMFEAERIKRYLEKDDTEKAYEAFERLFRTFLGIRPHQYREAIRFLAKYEKTGEGGHLLGWEMRSGKTLAMLSIGYFGALLYGKDVFFYPKTANVNDIIYQAVSFIPSLTVAFRAYESGDLDISVVNKRIFPFVSSNVFPNIFRFVSGSREKSLQGNKIFVGRGNTANRLLKTYAKEMEELIDIARTKGFSFEKDIDESKPYAFVKDLEGFSPEVRMATYWYFERLERKRLLELSNIEGFKALEESMRRFSDRLIEFQKKNEQAESYPFTFHIVPKGQLPAFNYRISFDKKEEHIQTSRFSSFSLIMKKDFSFEFDDVEDKEGENIGANEITSDYDDYLITTREKIEEIIKEFSDELRQYLNIHEVELGTAGTKSITGISITLSDDAPEEIISQFEELMTVINSKFEKYSDYYESLFNAFVRYKELSANTIFSSLAFSNELQEGFEEKSELTLKKLKVFSLPIDYNKDEEKLKVLKLFAERADANNPAKVEKVIPSSLDCIVKFSAKNTKSKKVVFELIADADKEEVPEIFVCSQSSARNYFISSEFFADKKDEMITIVDEVDEASDPKAVTYRVIYYASKNSVLKVGGTGTPTSGYPETIAALMGIVADAPLSSVTGTMQVIKDSFSLSETSPEGAKAIPYLILETLSATMEKERFIKEILSFSTAGKNPSEAFESFASIIKAYNKDEYGTPLNLFLEFVVDKTLKNGNPHAIVAKIEKFMISVKKFIKNQNLDFYNPDSFKFAITETAKRMGYIKRAAGTFDPIGYVSSLEGASLSLNTRQALKSESEGREIKEVKNFDLDNITSIYTAMKGQGYVADSADPDFFAPFSFSARSYVDVDVAMYSQSFGLSTIWDYISTNMKALVNEVFKKPELLLKTAIPERKKHSAQEVEQVLLQDLQDPDIDVDVNISDAVLEKVKKIVNELGGVEDCIYEYSSNSLTLVKEIGGESVDIDLNTGSVEKRTLSIEDYKAKATWIDSKSFFMTEEDMRNLYAYQLDEELTPRDVKNALSRSSRSSNDDIYSIVKHYITSGYDWNKTFKELQITDSKKQKIAQLFWNEFVDTFIRDYKNLLIKIEMQQKKEKDEEIYISTRAGYKIKPLVVRITGSDKQRVELNAKGNPGRELITASISGSLKSSVVLFSEDLRLGREFWRSILKEGQEPFFDFRYHYLSSSDFEVIDSFSNKGYFEKILLNTVEGRNFLITSPRVYSFLIGVYDAVTAAYEAKLKGKSNCNTIHFLVRASSKEMKDLLMRIDTKKLEQAGIYFKIFKNNADLDGESKKIKKILKMEQKKGIKETQLIVAATDETIARGVDLSHLDEMVVLGANNSGKTASQLFARLFNATDKHEANIYIAGTPLKIFAKENDEKVVASGSFYKVISLLAKTRFIDDIISGTLVNVANTSSMAIKLVDGVKEKVAELMKEMETNKTNREEFNAPSM